MNTLNSYILEIEGALNPRYAGNMHHKYFRNGIGMNVRFIHDVLKPGLNMYPNYQVKQVLPVIYDRVFGRYNAQITFEDFIKELNKND